MFEHSLHETAGDDLAKLLLLKSPSSEVWFDRRTNFTRWVGRGCRVGRFRIEKPFISNNPNKIELEGELVAPITILMSSLEGTSYYMAIFYFCFTLAIYLLWKRYPIKLQSTGISPWLMQLLNNQWLQMILVQTVFKRVRKIIQVWTKYSAEGEGAPPFA